MLAGALVQFLVHVLPATRGFRAFPRDRGKPETPPGLPTICGCYGTCGGFRRFTSGCGRSRARRAAKSSALTPCRCRWTSGARSIAALALEVAARPAPSGGTRSHGTGRVASGTMPRGHAHQTTGTHDNPATISTRWSSSAAAPRNAGAAFTARAGRLRRAAGRRGTSHGTNRGREGPWPGPSALTGQQRRSCDGTNRRGCPASGWK
jgi:hypothetical protein